VYDIINLVGFTQQERENLFQLLAGVIHLGDIKFKACSASHWGTPG
jgi:myosin heavy subunit